MGPQKGIITAITGTMHTTEAITRTHIMATRTEAALHTMGTAEEDITEGDDMGITAATAGERRRDLEGIARRVAPQ